MPNDRHSEPFGVDDYVRPAILRLDFAVDVKVSLAQNCKTTLTNGSGTAPCSPPGGQRPCQSAGS